VDSYLGPLFCSTSLHVCFCASTCFLYYCFVIWFEVRYCDTSSITLFAEYCLDNSWSLVFPNELQGRFFNLCDECHWDFDGNFIKHVDWFWEYSHFYYVDSTNP
jgi:hypothetical protein